MISAKNERVVITLPKELLKLLDEFARLNAYSSRSRAFEAILREYLISMRGLEIVN